MTPVLLSFGKRVGARPAWTWLAFRAPRWLVALGLALLPALALLVLALALPRVSEPERVRETFARFISGIITAATIAVGFSTLSLRRGLKGIGELERHARADAEFAEEVASLTGRTAALDVGETLAVVLDATASRAREDRAHELAMHADEVAARVRQAAGRPDALLEAALDLDAEHALHEARGRGDEKLAHLLRVAHTGRAYVKTLALQWGLSRMSQAIALTSMLAVVVASGVVLAYDRSAGAPFVLAASALVVILPLAVFVSYALKFTFVNQHTLPIGHFVLGPEDSRVGRVTSRTRAG